MIDSTEGPNPGHPSLILYKSSSSIITCSYNIFNIFIATAPPELFSWFISCIKISRMPFISSIYSPLMRSDRRGYMSNTKFMKNRPKSLFYF